ncbi:MAG: glycoside hydrolase family 3 N-terminal domain-containing protein [Mycetocola sp.]
MSLELKAASLLMVHAPGTDPAPLRDLVDQGVSGLILMGDNIPEGPEQLRTLTSALQTDAQAPILIGVDQEGGVVRRLNWDSTTGAGELRDAPPDATRAAYASRADVLAASGVNVNFGIVADVTADTDSFIWDRVLGTDPQSASERVAAAVRGERSGGLVASTVKHFPGHGAALGDSHASIPLASLTIDEWRTLAAPPFEAAIDAGADLVMTGHLTYPAVAAAPASLSTEWHRILREELGFEGVVVTDDMLMLQHNGLAEYADPGENAVRAVAAGSDLLLYVLPADPSSLGISVQGLSASIAEGVRSGRIAEERLDDAARRVLELRYDLATEAGR